MEDSCLSEGCKNPPKYSCICDRTLNMCEYHIKQHKEIGGTHSQIPSQAEARRIHDLTHQNMSQLFKISSKTLVAGKQMFQEICNKLCKITDELASRQTALINIEKDITEKGDYKVRFKSTEEFHKIIENYFSDSDTTIDFAIFSEKFNEISERIEINNGYLKLVADKNSDEKERLESELKKMKIESESERKALEKRLEDISDLVKKLAFKEQVCSLEKDSKDLKTKVEELNRKSEQHNQAIEITKKFTNEQKKEIETQSKSITDYCHKAFNEMTINHSEFEKKAESQISESKIFFTDLFSKTAAENTNNLLAEVTKINKILEDELNNIKKIQDKFENDFREKSDKNTAILEAEIVRINKFFEEKSNNFEETNNRFQKKINEDLDKKDKSLVKKIESINKLLEDEFKKTKKLCSGFNLKFKEIFEKNAKEIQEKIVGMENKIENVKEFQNDLISKLNQKCEKNDSILKAEIVKIDKLFEDKSNKFEESNSRFQKKIDEDLDKKDKSLEEKHKSINKLLEDEFKKTKEKIVGMENKIENVKEFQNGLISKLNQKSEDLSNKINSLEINLSENSKNHKENIDDINKRIKEANIDAVEQFNLLNGNCKELLKNMSVVNINMDLLEPIIEKERLEKERLEKERLEKERLEKERQMLIKTKSRMKYAEEFNKMTLNNKRENARALNLQNFSNYDDSDTKEIFISYDGKYMFLCKL
ncbi:hypothetical protein SteCoe_31550 [Stentor coeruleus]|uniref:Uncharacterized protein n=1 Tax=Stentor coeruleus TaxID=5963 RepID=A0A1R2B137_9CILI|nr:hypothetical protein SteCoe_31550 [Stentor coeruleus]